MNPPASRRSADVFFLALALSVLALALPARGLAELAFRREAVLAGQPWRLLTCHLVHAGWPHVLLNVGGAALVWAAFGPRCRGGRWVVAAAAAGLGSALGVLAWHPEVRAMAGLSGLLHGLMATGVIAELRAGGRLGIVFGVVLLAKIALEQLAGGATPAASWLGGNVATAAHLHGALAGLCAGLVLTRRGDRRRL